MQINFSQLAKEEYCYLTTRGRNTGNPHEIEIWFCIYNDSIYLMSGGREKSDWVKNLIKGSNVIIRIGKQTFSATARIVDGKEEDKTIRNLMANKYNEREKDKSLSEWAQGALVIGFDVKEN